MKNDSSLGFTTKAIHAGQGSDPTTRAAATPIYQTATYTFDDVSQPAAIFNGEREGYTYTRAMNPTSHALDFKVAALEGAEDSVTAASGMGAIAATLFTLLNAGDHLLTGDTLYSGSSVLIHNLERFGVDVTYVDMSNEDEIRNNIKSNTKVIYIESPANPTLKLTDIKYCAQLAHDNNALLVIDSTFAPPPIQYPLSLGADLVIHSTTKYMAGHGDAIGGVVSGSKELVEPIRKVGIKFICGAPPSPFNSFLTLRGLKTLPMRIRKHCENAMALALYLESHPYVKKVYYPGLESHPQHALATAQMHDGMYGGVVTFDLKDNIEGIDGFEACKTVMNNLNIIGIGVSLGELDTLVEHAASMTHSAISKEERVKAGISDTQIRLAVGCEDINDLIGDFEQAFAKIKEQAK